ncbi:DNA repair ATPase, partial [Streptomyces hyaluromycini]
MGVEDGTYQILRQRLADRAAELGRQAASLNSRRQEAFGSRPLELAGSARPRTGGEGTACGVVAVRPDVLLLGTSAPGLDAGLLSLHTPDGSALGPEKVPGLLDDERFHRDLAELLRYYRDARLTDLRRTASGRLLAVFRTGENEGDLRVLSWQLAADRVEYLGNHGERDLPQPPVSELPWTTTGREYHADGRILIEGGEGAVSVATTGGSLTVRAHPGDRPLFQEAVDEPLQSLADATVAYAATGPLLLLRIRPYNEPADRYLVVNTRTGSVRRQDSVGRGARLLPAEQGLIFPGGYELADGSHRAFRIGSGAAALGAGSAADGSAADELRFDALLPSPNGEDLLYVLRRPGRAQVLLLPWNTVRREAASALQGAAYALLPDGTLILLRPDHEPVRTHELQLWQTPFQSAEHAAAQPVGDGPLARIGNADLVGGIADCLDVVRSATAAAQENRTTASPELILDACAKAADRHYWLADTGLLEPLTELRDAAEQLAAEQARVRQLAARAAQALDEARAEAAALVRRSHGEPPADADAWTVLLAELRRAQGRTRTLRELPQLDLAALERVEAELAAELAAATERAFAFFAGPDAFAAPLAAARHAAEEAASIATAAEAARLADR